MAYEASEIMTASALLFDNNELDKVTNVYKVKELMDEAINKIKKGTIIEFGSTAIENGFLNKLKITIKSPEDYKNKSNLELFKDMVVGISAAKALRTYIATENPSGGRNPKIYMTGNVWPKRVEPFRISVEGFKDYNSSDILISPDDELFFGVSLKKKRTVGAPEPTLVNKAFDTVLQGKEFDELREKLDKERRNYFIDVVIKAVDEGVIKYTDISVDGTGKKLQTSAEWEQFKQNPSGRKELYDCKFIDKKMFKRKPDETPKYINVKGYADSDFKINNEPKPYLDEKPNGKGMRDFVNRQLSKKDAELWKNYVKIMQEYSELFGKTLLSVILKIKLYENINVELMRKNKFNFCLATGVGNINAKGDVVVGRGTVIPLKTTLCGLTRIDEKFGNQPYKIVVDEVMKESKEAASIFLTLSKGQVSIVDLVLRYKGNFTAQPNFLGTMTTEFKQLLEKECGT